MWSQVFLSKETREITYSTFGLVGCFTVQLNVKLNFLHVEIPLINVLSLFPSDRLPTLKQQLQGKTSTIICT